MTITGGGGGSEHSHSVCGHSRRRMASPRMAKTLGIKARTGLGGEGGGVSRLVASHLLAVTLIVLCTLLHPAYSVIEERGRTSSFSFLPSCLLVPFLLITSFSSSYSSSDCC